MTNSAAPRRADSDFTSGGTRCSGWLYLPEAATPRPPVVVMAHGFGAERTFRLPAFAERFVARGLAVFLFDYRGFGASDGAPRQWVSPRRHLEDWLAAVEHVKGLASVDPGRLALWGTSFGGGHVLVVAARTPGITAVVAQVPLLDGLAVAALGRHLQRPHRAAPPRAHRLLPGALRRDEPARFQTGLLEARARRSCL